jgi:hypothetical protein
MARPERHDVDYFPFYVKDGKTLFVLEGKYQSKGTGFFCNVMRFLCTTPDHHFCIKDEADRLFFFTKTHCDEESGLDMLNMMATTGKIHKELWKNNMVIASQDFLDSIAHAYKNRKNPIIKIDDILVSYQQNGITYEQNIITSDDNTQTKLNYTKLNNSIVKKFKKPSLEEITLYCQERKNNIKPQYFIDYQEARGWKLKGGQKIKDWKAVIRTWEANGKKYAPPSAPKQNYFEPVNCPKCGKRIVVKGDLTKDGCVYCP